MSSWLMLGRTPINAANIKQCFAYVSTIIYIMKIELKYIFLDLFDLPNMKYIDIFFATYAKCV